MEDVNYVQFVILCMSNELIPVRMLVQYAYCNRLGYLEWVQGEFETNYYVADGKYRHRNVDKPSGSKKLQEEAETIHASSVMLSDADLGIIGKIDRMETSGDVATPIEYKRGKTPDTPTKWYESNMVQVCAQALLLRANGYRCDRGIIYYVESKERVAIEFTDEMVKTTLECIDGMKKMAAENTIPAPLVDSPKCPGCSLVGICLPDETHMLADPGRGVRKDSIRRMYPARPDTKPVYVQEQGARIGKSGGNMRITSRDGNATDVRLMDVSEVNVYGNVQITTQAVREMCSLGIPTCYHTYGGWFVGMTTGGTSKNADLRICQHATHHKKKESLAIAREIVHAKIRNSITMLRRNHSSKPESTIEELGRLAMRAKKVQRYDSLLGLEGLAARGYFAEFSGMLKEDVDFDFTGRNRRPPKDPVNAVLSFLYSMLTSHATIAVAKVGFDPYIGYLHRPKYGKPSLALDMIEEFRPIVADSVCITLLNTRQLTKVDFVSTSIGTNMNTDGRKKVIAAFASRMDSVVTHPLLGYAASYRRIMEVQARLLARHLLGEIPAYKGFKTK